MGLRAEPVEIGTLQDVNQRTTMVRVTAPSSLLELSQDGVTRLILSVEGARDLMALLERGIRTMGGLP